MLQINKIGIMTNGVQDARGDNYPMDNWLTGITNLKAEGFNAPRGNEARRPVHTGPKPTYQEIFQVVINFLG